MANLHFHKMILILSVMISVGMAIAAGVVYGFMMEHHSRHFRTGLWDELPLSFESSLIVAEFMLRCCFYYALALLPGLALFRWVKRDWGDFIFLFSFLTALTGIVLFFTFVCLVVFK